MLAKSACKHINARHPGEEEKEKLTIYISFVRTR